MNKIYFLIAVCATMLIPGCMEIPMGYTPDTDWQTTPRGQKYAITYSVDYLSDGDISIGRASQRQYIGWIKSAMEQSGAFSSVAYREFHSKSNYHIHFLVHYSCMPVNEAVATGYVMGSTFMAIPMWINMYLDISAIVYLNGVPVYAPCTAENIRCYVWLPFFPVGLVWNQWWAWTTQEKKCCRYLLNQIIEYQYKLAENNAAK